MPLTAAVNSVHVGVMTRSLLLNPANVLLLFRPSTVYQHEAAYSLGGHDMVDWSARDTDESDYSYSPSEEESGTDSDEDTESGERRKTPQVNVASVNTTRKGDNKVNPIQLLSFSNTPHR